MRVMDNIGLIDFKGQRDAQKYTQLMLYLSALLAFVVGFTIQDVHITLYIFLAGVLLTFLVCATQGNEAWESLINIGHRATLANLQDTARTVARK